MICPDCKAENIPGADFCWNCSGDLHSFDLPSAEDIFTHHLMNDRLRDLSAKEPPPVAPGDPLGFAIHAMRRGESGCVLVMEGNELVGIITERDVLLKAAGDRVDLNAIAVREIMSRDPVTLSEDDTLAVALHKMSVGEFRHIPVVMEGGPTRVVSIQDVFEHISALISGQPAGAS
jgi:CBS domain-containing protein